MIGTATHRDRWTQWIAMTAFLTMAFAAVLLAGCTKREKVLDVETPGGGVEIYQESDTPDVNPE